MARTHHTLTQALSEPLPTRRRWSIDEVVQMTRAGILVDEDRVELIEGELYQMAPKGNRHEMMQRRLARFLSRVVRDDVAVSVEPSLYLTDDSAPEPDLLVFPDHLRIKDVRGPDVLLAVEVADSSLGLDIKVKAPLYAEAGIAHLWVISVRSDVVYLFSRPDGPQYDGYRMASFDERIPLPFSPSVQVRLADLMTTSPHRE